MASKPAFGQGVPGAEAFELCNDESVLDRSESGRAALGERVLAAIKGGDCSQMEILAAIWPGGVLSSSETVEALRRAQTGAVYRLGAAWARGAARSMLPEESRLVAKKHLEREILNPPSERAGMLSFISGAASEGRLGGDFWPWVCAQGMALLAVTGDSKGRSYDVVGLAEVGVWGPSWEAEAAKQDGLASKYGKRLGMAALVAAMCGRAGEARGLGAYMSEKAFKPEAGWICAGLGSKLLAQELDKMREGSVGRWVDFGPERLERSKAAHEAWQAAGAQAAAGFLASLPPDWIDEAGWGELHPAAAAAAKERVALIKSLVERRLVAGDCLDAMPGAGLGSLRL